MDIVESLKWRYAVKKFDDIQIIEDSKIEKLTEAFNLTATSYGLQPLKLIVIKNKELQLKIKEIAFNQEQVSTASHLLVICIEKKIDEPFIDRYFDNIKSQKPKQLKEIENYHKVLLDRFKNKKDNEITLWATKQAYIALGNLLTVCALEKIDSCPMEGFIPAKLDALLNLEEKNIASTLLLPVGFREKEDQNANSPKIRRPILDIIEHIF